MSGKHSAGKGDRYRKVDYDLWSKNWDSIFKKKKPKTTRSKSEKGKS
jgi:hypothetical protein